MCGLCLGGFTPHVGDGRLAQDDRGQDLRGIIQSSADECAPGMTVIFDFACGKIAPPGIGKDHKVADGVHAFEDDLAFDGNRGGRHGGPNGRAGTRDPDEAGGEAAEVVGHAGEVIGLAAGDRLDGGEVAVLDAAFNAECGVKADRGVDTSAEDLGERRDGADIAVLVVGREGLNQVPFRPPSPTRTCT